MPSLNIVALISGGKDSFFSVSHCLRQGHKVVALANLHPPLVSGSTLEDLDSFMYQTIGHEVIPLYEEALGIPLYRQAITGTAVEQSKTYDASQVDERQDETEDLLSLLQRVKLAHPDINAVSTGAILSDYQRTRVESVALRLGLIPISYLWQYPRIAPESPVSLLQAMSNIGMDARIIKVSSGGLDDTFLWQNVASYKTMARLSTASARFGAVDDGAALGEGGEYETLVLNGPAPVWMRKIVVDDSDRTIVSGDAGTASIRIRNPRLEDKQATDQVSDLDVPALLDGHFTALLHDLKHDLKRDEFWIQSHTQSGLELHGSSIANDGPHVLLPAIVGEGPSAVDQITSIMRTIYSELSKLDHHMTDIAYVSIILRDMSDFAAVNKVYASSFSRPNPPARMTLACADMLPDGKHISVTVTSVKDSTSSPRTALHVQSISYWAPANVGPYSQAVIVPDNGNNATINVVFLAGQIPLEPATMQIHNIPNASDEVKFLHQAILGLQHLHRVAMAMSVRRWIHCVVFIVDCKNESMQRRAKIARQVWSRTYDKLDEGIPQPLLDDEDGEPDTFDVWHLKHGLSQSMASVTSLSYSERQSELFAASAPSLSVYRVDALPRNVQIEWVGFGSDSEDVSSMSIPHIDSLTESFKQQMI